MGVKWKFIKSKLALMIVLSMIISPCVNINAKQKIISSSGKFIGNGYEVLK